jgi:hypothetical protein
VNSTTNFSSADQTANRAKGNAVTPPFNWRGGPTRNRAWATCLFRAHLAMHEPVSSTGGESKHWFERVEFDSRTEAQEKVQKTFRTDVDAKHDSDAFGRNIFW